MKEIRHNCFKVSETIFLTLSTFKEEELKRGNRMLEMRWSDNITDGEREKEGV